MAINFVTGLPRHGKTLWTLVTVKDRAEREKRQVYTCNVPDVNIPGWLTIEHPNDWMDIEDGCIIIVDELQDFWGKESSSSRVPLPILELSKHGKRGIDFYFITQEPNLVHPTPRDLCQHHFYVVRAFGTHNATVRKFERMQLHPDKQKKLGEMTPWRYPKEAFTWYKSADVHNIKRSIPMKVKLLPVVGLLVIGSIYMAYKFASGTFDKAKAAPSQSAVGQSKAIAENQANQAKQILPMTPAQYMATFEPRVEGLAYTAPRYDEVTKVVTAPYPAACISMRGKCTCYSQQGTVLIVAVDLCEQIVKGGFFMDWSAGSTVAQATLQQAQPMPVQAPLQLNQPVTVAAVSPAQNGFNLPLPTVVKQYGEAYTTHQSGQIYYKR